MWKEEEEEEEERLLQAIDRSIDRSLRSTIPRIEYDEMTMIPISRSSINFPSIVHSY